MRPLKTNFRPIPVTDPLNWLVRWLSAVAIGYLAVANATTSTAQTTPNGRSVILFIGDGFDDQHVTMARNYLAGQAGTLALDTLPVRSAVQIETVGANGQPLYVADSANTATTIASGVVTHIGRVGTDPEDADTLTIAEQASAKGLRTGLVSTASVTDATPAAFAAHVAKRGCENPTIIMGGERYGRAFPGCPQDALANGGPGSIAEQIASSNIDLVLGGGRQHFATNQYDSTQTVMDLAADNGFSIVTTQQALLNADTNTPVLGLFAEEHLPVRLRGSNGRKAELPETSWLHTLHRYLGSVTQPLAMDCEPNPEFRETPDLTTLTAFAIDRLSNPNGFFLMVESASIDKQSHDRNPCGSIGEVAQLEEALGVALRYAAIHPDTLVIVTADHAQAAQIVPEPSLFESAPIPVYSPGKVARINTPEGGVMRINYATNNFVSEEHTGANVPLFANSPKGVVIPTFMRQRDLYALMVNYLNLGQQ